MLQFFIKVLPSDTTFDRFKITQYQRQCPQYYQKSKMKEELLVKYQNVPKKTCLDRLLNRKPTSENEDRMIIANLPDPDIGSNQISTSKYNLISFPLFNLLEQFTKPSNIYFLVIGILQMIPAISVSEGKPTMFFPLTMVVVISMVKDFFEDWKRRKSDKQENQSQIEVLNQLGWSKMKWQDVQVGNIIRVKKDEYFPCDVLLLKHGLQAKLAYVQTKNLDGQTNLKLKKIPQSLLFLQKEPEHQLENIHIEIFFQKPNQFINSFNGNLKFNDKKYPLQNSNLILRGCSLKINSYAIGVCIYNGHQTKIMQNNSHAVPKRSSLEKKLNSYFKFICIFQILATLICSLSYGGIISTRYDSLSYISESPYYLMDVVSDWGSWFISISNFIPISLLVTLELVRYGQGWVITKNKKSDKESIEVQTSSVNEELGQIEYIMSDKTGTLTQNLMQFKCILINNENYGIISEQERQIRERKPSMLSEQDTQIEISPEIAKQLEQQIANLNIGSLKISKQQSRIGLGGKIGVQKLKKINELIENGKDKFVDFHGQERERLLYDLRQEIKRANIQNDGIQEEEVKYLHYTKNRIHGVLLHLALCHNVIKETNGYSSSSPDQLALVSFAKNIGYEFIEKDDDGYMIVNIGSQIIPEGKTLKYKLLHILEFTSERKRMSVILEDQSNPDNILLLIKGADDVMVSRASEQITQHYITELNQSLYAYAYQGLRTLVLGYKTIDRQSYQKWNAQYNEAIIYIGNDRMDKIYELQNEIQKNIQIIGATAIEDKLQDKVKQTIEELKKSGIKVWMLTGDKKQTAISIGFSCGLISQTCEKITLDCEPEHAENLISNVHSLLELNMLNGEKVVIISGEILKKMKAETQQKLAHLLKQCSSVICCRVSPKDKENLTKMVMEWGRTLAVGDGANDVNMINAANIGVGVRGIEGSQATRAADYVIGQFQNLKKLVLFYGMNFYYRNSQVTLFNLYKNILVTFPILAYGPLSLLSSTYIYDTWIFQFYNTFYTSLPIIIFGLTNIKYSQYQLSKNPLIYRVGQENTFFNTRTLVSIFLTSALFGCLFVYVTYYTTEYSILPEGYMTFQIWSGMLVFNICVFSANIRIFMVSNQISSLLLISVLMSVISYYLVFIFVGTILYSDVRNVLSKQLSSGTFWLVLLTMTFAIEMMEWTLNKIINENTNKHSLGHIKNDEQDTGKNVLNEEQPSDELDLKKKRSRGKKSSSSERRQDQIINDINGGYAFAEDEQRSMHFI